MNWREEVAFNEKVLDGLDLPEPESGQELRQWKRQVELAMEGIELPPELVGNPFNFMAENDLAIYLQKRFSVRVVEDTRYVIWRVR